MGVLVKSRGGVWRVRDGKGTDPMLTVGDEPVWFEKKTRADFEGDNCIEVVADSKPKDFKQPASSYVPPKVQPESKESPPSVAPAPSGPVNPPAGSEASPPDSESPAVGEHESEHKKPSGFFGGRGKKA